MEQDILSVADACGFEHFIIWGMSYGGKIGRYLASQYERVAKIILMGTPMGPGASGELRHAIENSCMRWPPILQAQRDGTLDLDSLSEADREFLLHFNVPVILAWGQACSIGLASNHLILYVLRYGLSVQQTSKPWTVSGNTSNA